MRTHEADFWSYPFVCIAAAAFLIQGTTDILLRLFFMLTDSRPFCAYSRAFLEIISFQFCFVCLLLQFSKSCGLRVDTKKSISPLVHKTIVH